MFEWESRNIDGHVVSERYMCECMLASLCCACCNAECIGMGVLFVYTCWVCMSQLNCLCCVVVGGCFGLHPRSPPLSIRAFHPLSTHSSSTLHPLFIHSPPPFPLFIRSPSAVVACVPVRPGVQLQFRYCCLMAQVFKLSLRLSFASAGCRRRRVTAAVRVTAAGTLAINSSLLAHRGLAGILANVEGGNLSSGGVTLTTVHQHLWSRRNCSSTPLGRSR